MREILFRAKTEPCSKDAISGKIELKPKWVYGYIDLGYMQDEKGAIISDEKAHSAYRCQYSTIGQYTGLKDKNGQRIFEGDIVHLKGGCISGFGAVEFKNGCFGIADTKRKRFYLLDDNSIYRIDGNIHDNPELLRTNKDDQPSL